MIPACVAGGGVGVGVGGSALRCSLLKASGTVKETSGGQVRPRTMFDACGAFSHITLPSVTNI